MTFLRAWQLDQNIIFSTILYNCQKNIASGLWNNNQNTGMFTIKAFKINNLEPEM